MDLTLYIILKYSFGLCYPLIVLWGGSSPRDCWIIPFLIHYITYLVNALNLLSDIVSLSCAYYDLIFSHSPLITTPLNWLVIIGPLILVFPLFVYTLNFIHSNVNMISQGIVLSRPIKYPTPFICFYFLDMPRCASCKYTICSNVQIIFVTRIPVPYPFNSISSKFVLMY